MPDLTTFKASGVPLLAAGVSNHALGISDNLWVHLKIYASGGENGLHAHPNEDHAFFLLQGTAEFTNARGETFDVGRYEGVFLPKGAEYRFRCTSDENLVMLRVGGADSSPLVGEAEADDRLDALDPSMNAADFPAKLAVRTGAGRRPVQDPSAIPVPVPGAFFGDQ